MKEVKANTRKKIGVKIVRENDKVIKWEDYFYYDETSPSGLRWKVDRYGGAHGLSLMTSAGNPAGTKIYRECGKPKCYRVKVAGKPAASAQRIIFELFGFEVPEGWTIDHIDGNPFNNALDNLKLKTRKGNSHNMQTPISSSTGFVGVSWVVSKSGKTTQARATWSEDGKKRYKYFNAQKLGLLPAFQMACEYRLEQLQRMNKNGAEYTFRSYNAIH